TPGEDSAHAFAAVEALGCALIDSKQPAEAASVFETWLREPPQTSLTNSVNVAFAKGWLGTALEEQGKFEQGDVLQRESLELKRRLLPSDDPAIGWHLYYWAMGFEKRGNFAEIQALINEAWGIAELHPADSVHLEYTLAFYGHEWMGTWA